jgi:hypothetical protein
MAATLTFKAPRRVIV